MRWSNVEPERGDPITKMSFDSIGYILISRHRFGWSVGARLRGRQVAETTPRNGAPT
jgi:hypothetical protein